MIDVSDLNKADVLAALYNASRPQGMGFLQFDKAEMTRPEAEVLLAKTKYFDYLHGRVMKITIEDELDPRLYDRDNGQGAVQRVIDALRANDSKTITQMGSDNLQDAAIETSSRLHQKTTVDGNIVTLGLAESADKLRKAIDEATK